MFTSISITIYPKNILVGWCDAQHEIWSLQHAQPVTHMRWIHSMQSSVKNIYTIFITYSKILPNILKCDNDKKLGNQYVRFTCIMYQLVEWEQRRLHLVLHYINMCDVCLLCTQIWIIHVNAMSPKRNLLHLKCRIDSKKTNNNSIAIFGEILFLNSW